MALERMEVSGLPNSPTSTCFLQVSALPWTPGELRWAEDAEEAYVSYYLFLKAIPTTAGDEGGGLDSAQGTINLYKKNDGSVDLSRAGVTITLPPGGSFDFALLNEYEPYVKPDVSVDGSQVTVSLRADPDNAPPDNLFEVLTGVAKRCYVEPTFWVVVKDQTGKFLMRKLKRVPVEIPCPIS